MPSSESESRWGSRHVAMPDGSDATSPLNCCRGGRGGLFVVGELLRDLQERTGLGFVLVKERGEAEHVQGGRVFLVGGDNQFRLRIYIVPVGNQLGASDGRYAPSLSISWVSQSISSLMPFLQAYSRFRPRRRYADT
jgi:hypothetical protein